jgi:hypothetical protein
MFLTHFIYHLWLHLTQRDGPLKDYLDRIGELRFIRVEYEDNFLL